KSQAIFSNAKMLRRVPAPETDPLQAKISRPDFYPAESLFASSIDLSMGFAQALRAWKAFLKPGGSLAVTEAVWLRMDAPEPVRWLWEEYPDLKDTQANLAIISECGYEVAGRFTLPESAWRDHYYTPLEKRLAELPSVYAANREAQDILAYRQNEIDIYRQHSDYYGYEFFVCQFMNQSCVRCFNIPRKSSSRKRRESIF
ncbi:MAG: hypothetical protein WCB96_13405, partial [Candidatus Aminicenantales bacterium]